MAEVERGLERRKRKDRRRKQLRVLLADGDRAALDRLEDMVRDQPGVARVTTVSTGGAALRAVAEAHPDVVVMETHLPDIEGTQLAAELSQLSPRPWLVFVTHDPSLAIEAFALGANDYLLKPVTRRRLAMAWDRLGARGVEDPFSGEDDSQRRKIALPSRTAEGVELVELSSLVLARSAGGGVEVVTDSGAHRVPAGLGELERRLESCGFYRVHRSFLVNLRRVSELRATVGGAVVVMVDGTIVPAARRKLSPLRQRLRVAERL